MAWTDKPSEAQLGTIYSWIRWEMTNEQAQKAVAWLENKANKRAVSNEMQRIKQLKDNHKLTKDKCFESAVWEGFGYE